MENIDLKTAAGELQKTAAALRTKYATKEERQAGMVEGATSLAVGSVVPFGQPIGTWLISRNATNRAEQEGLVYGDSKDTFTHRHPHLSTLGHLSLGASVGSLAGLAALAAANRGKNSTLFEKLNLMGSSKLVSAPTWVGGAAGAAIAGSKINDLSANRARKENE